VRIDKKFVATLLGIDESEVGALDGIKVQLDVPDDGVTFQELVDKRWKKQLDGLAAALRRADSLGKVVRGHLYIEHELNDFIYFAAPNPAILKEIDKEDKPEFSLKVRLAVLLGLDPQLKPGLKAAARLRNQFAHRLETKLGKDDVRNLAATLPASVKKQFHDLVKEGLAVLDTSPLTVDQQARARSFLETQMELTSFFLTLFLAISKERNRAAFERFQTVARH
jgi:hypothetical protein